MQHPFLVRLRGTFQDDEAVFLAMEFVAGGEFFTLLREKGRYAEMGMSGDVTFSIAISWHLPSLV